MIAANAREMFQDDSGITVESSSPEWVCLRIAPDLDLKLKVVNYFRQRMQPDLPPDLCEQLCVALDELLANAMEHGCQNGDQRTIELTHMRTARAVLFQLRDAGPGFSWKSLRHAAINNPIEDPLQHIEFRSKMGLRPGGFGIMLVRQIADELIYNEKGNEVLFVKYL